MDTCLVVQTLHVYVIDNFGVEDWFFSEFEQNLSASWNWLFANFKVKNELVAENLEKSCLL